MSSSLSGEWIVSKRTFIGLVGEIVELPHQIHQFDVFVIAENHSNQQFGASWVIQYEHDPLSVSVSDCKL